MLSIPIKFRYLQHEDGTISRLEHVPMYEHMGLGQSWFDTFVKDYSISDDNKGINFTMVVPKPIYDLVVAERGGKEGK